MDPDIICAIFLPAIMMYQISSMSSHIREIIVLLLSTFAIEFVVLIESNIFSIRLRKGKPCTSHIPTMLSLIDIIIIAFQAVVAPPGANIWSRRKLPLMFVV